jgi:hypothetical protein
MRAASSVSDFEIIAEPHQFAGIFAEFFALTLREET